MGECPDQGPSGLGATYCTVFDFPFFFAILSVAVVNKKQGYHGNDLWFARNSWI